MSNIFEYFHSFFEYFYIVFEYFRMFSNVFERFLHELARLMRKSALLIEILTHLRTNLRIWCEKSAHLIDGNPARINTGDSHTSHEWFDRGFD